MAKPEVEQLLELKARREAGGSLFSVDSDIDRLEMKWVEYGAESKHFMDFIPIRLVTYIEVFVKDAVRDLIDIGEPYISRSETMSKGAKIDFTALRHLQGSKLTAGEIISHSISVSDPTKIIANLGTLIPNFVVLLKESHERWEEERDTWPLEPIIENYNSMMDGLEKLFRVRHIVTHEMVTSPVYEEKDAASFFKSAREFVQATQWVIVRVLDDATPKTQGGMNRDAASRLEKAEAELKNLIDAIRANTEFDVTLFDAADAAWEVFAEAQASLDASQWDGGTMYPFVWASTKAREVMARIESLREWARTQNIEIR